MPRGRTLQKVSVNLPQDDIDALRTIADKKGITMTEALRRAIAMERFIEEAQENDEKFLIQGKDDVVRQLLIR